MRHFDPMTLYSHVVDIFFDVLFFGLLLFSQMAKNVLKFFAAGLALVAVAVGVLFLVNYVRYRRSPEYRAEKYFQDLERRYREDTYGGTTPEETLQLFIDALKKGDIELASRYFVIDEQEKWKNKLSEIKESDRLQSMVGDLRRAEKGRQESNQAIFAATNNQNVVTVLIDIRKIENGRWKILDL